MHPPSCAACTPAAVEPRLGRHHASCILRLSALCVAPGFPALAESEASHACDSGLSPPSASLGRDCRVFASRMARVTAASACASPRRCTLAGGVWRSARAGRWRNPRAVCQWTLLGVGVVVGARVAWCGWGGGGREAGWRGACGEEVVRWPTGKPRGRPRLTCSAFSFSSFSTLCPLIFAIRRPRRIRCIRCIRIPLSFSRSRSLSPRPTSANLCSQFLQVISGSCAVVARILSVHNCSYFSRSRSPAITHFRARLSCSRHFLSISISISIDLF